MNLINYGETPQTLTLLNTNITKTAKDYVPPELIKKYSRTGILRASFRDKDSGILMPIEIHLAWRDIIEVQRANTPKVIE